MGLRERLGEAFAALTRSDDDTPPPSDPSTALIIPPRASSSSSGVTAAEAFSLSIVYRAVQILVTSVKQLSIDAYRGQERADSQPQLIRKPSIDEPRSAFLEQTVVSLACAGNAYWRIDGGGTSLTVLNPLDMLIESTRGGQVTGYKYGGREFKPEQIQHLKLMRVPGTAYGLGPIQAAQRELRGAIELRDYSSGWFNDAGVPNGVLKTDQVLSPDDAKRAKDAWHDSQGAKRGVAVLGNGISYAPIYLNPRDAQFLESRQFTVTEIARLFGVPSSLMLASVEGSTDTYQNVSQDWLGFVRFSLMSYLIEIEDAFTMLLPRGQDAKFNVEALLRSDTTTRYAAHKTGLEAGFLTVDEVRGWEHLPPLNQPTVKEPANA